MCRHTAHETQSGERRNRQSDSLPENLQGSSNDSLQKKRVAGEPGSGCAQSYVVRASTERFVQRGGLVEDTVLDHESRVSHVADALRGIAVHEHQVGELARRDRAELLVFARDARCAERRDAQDFRRLMPAFTYNSSSRCRVNPGRSSVHGDDGNPRVVEQLVIFSVASCDSR